MPERGAVLEGSTACLGSAMLTGRGGHVYAVIFDLIDISRGDAWERLHAWLTP